LKPIDIQTIEDGEKANKKNSEDEKSKTPFDQLVIPDEHKRMVLSLIAQHFRDKESASSDNDQADIVRGKGMKFITFLRQAVIETYPTFYSGKGLILLLHGAPGVGKTTTAG
jgi:flagellar biosynthesis GTPase FlhF